MKGLSSGTLQKVTIFAQPMNSLSAVRLPMSSSTSAMRITASMLMPARVLATLTEEQTAWVPAMASGMAWMRASSPRVKPFCTMALKPPTKSMPTAAAARSSACATWTKSAGSALPIIWEMGVTATRRLTIGMPYLRCTLNATGTRSWAQRAIFS